MGVGINEESPFCQKPPKLRHDYLLGLVFVLMAGILLVRWLPDMFYLNFTSDISLTIHIILMFFNVVVSLTVFVAGWYDYRQTGSIREIIISLTFLMVGLIDVAHTLSYPGMPDFFTTNSLNKSTTFWVASRIVESIGLCLAVIIKPVNKPNLRARLIVFLTVVFSLTLVVSIAYQFPVYPEMFAEETGQTSIKVFLDYLIIFIKGLAMYYLIKKNRNYMADYYLQAALIFGIFSEASFTLYADAYDTYNLLGHIYKIFEFAYIMKALFILSFVRLYQTNAVLHNQKRRMADINLQLEKANKLKDEFLTNTNHELRTPLTAIIAFTELLLDKETGPLNNVQRDYINEINESSQQLLFYINNLLDLSKIEAGKMELHREMVRVEDIFEKATRKTLPLFKTKEQEFVQEIDGKIPPFYADPAKIIQVLINLLSNANKFTPGKGRIKMSASLAGGADQVIISVSDNGVGISEENQQIIFEKFSQVNETLTSLHPGTGLGLALAKHLVHLHGGQIEVKSKVGEGSSFYFSIPLSEEDSNEEQ